MNSSEITSLSLSELQSHLRSGTLHAVDVLDALATEIDRVDPAIGAYLDYDLKTARRLAETADPTLPLGGLPIAIKDNINVKGQPTTCASRILQGYHSLYDAGVVSRLRAAGAIPFGRLNMDEFAMGSSTETSALKTTKNPWDTERIPGGSSGGSAASVAARTAFVALGSDTGGSIRQPASLCGCVGLKPSYGRVSRYGLVAFASSLDQIGPLARTVRDAALLLNVIAGHDHHDSSSVDLPVPDYTSALGKEPNLKGRRIGIPKEFFIKGIDPQVRAAIDAAIKQCEALGAELIDISLPNTEHAISVYYIIATAEASSNLARFEGIRYGNRAKDPKDLSDLYLRTRSEGFGPEVKRRIILGTYVLSSGYYDAYYLRAQKVRTLMRQDFSKAFEQVDAILCPTSPDVAFKLGERMDDPLKMYLADIFTLSANLAGIPGISIPCGFAETDGKKLPVGLQLLGKEFNEENLLAIAHAYEQSTDWHKATAAIS
ncbi:MAG: Asp-tRNA(Asn)/Glu-tRNA(Gln) amidotransferase subunit GatA [Chthoniobacterales bacterium]